MQGQLQCSDLTALQRKKQRCYKITCQLFTEMNSCPPADKGKALDRQALPIFQQQLMILLPSSFALIASLQGLLALQLK